MSKVDKYQGLLNKNSSSSVPANNQAKEELTAPVFTDVQPNVQRTVKKATFEIDADLHHWLKIYSVHNRKKMVEVVEDALRAYRVANE